MSVGNLLTDDEKQKITCSFIRILYSDFMMIIFRTVNTHYLEKYNIV